MESVLNPNRGFIRGAMYVGYAFTIAVIVIVGVVLYVLGDPAEWVAWQKKCTLGLYTFEPARRGGACAAAI